MDNVIADRPVAVHGTVSARPTTLQGTLLGIVGFCLITALFAQVRVPLPNTPVPMTLQVLAVLLTGYFLRPLPACAAMLLYLAAGTVWLPVFAPGSAGVLGVSGGYIVGFVLAAPLVAVVRRSSSSLGRWILAGALGTVVVFLSGVAWQVLGFGFTVGVAVKLGVIPFLPKAAIQLGMAVALVRAGDRLRSPNSCPKP